MKHGPGDSLGNDVHVIHLVTTRRRPVTLTLLCASLLAASAPSIPARAAADDPVVVETTSTSFWPEPGLGRDLLLSVTALLGLLVGMERLATWRLGVRQRREALDVTSALWSDGHGSAAPEISPVAWRVSLPGSRFPQTSTN